MKNEINQELLKKITEYDHIKLCNQLASKLFQIANDNAQYSHILQELDTESSRFNVELYKPQKMRRRASTQVSQMSKCEIESQEVEEVKMSENEISDYLQLLYRVFKIENSVLLCGMHYLFKMQYKGRMIICFNTIKTLLAISLFVAQKMIIDLEEDIVVTLVTIKLVLDEIVEEYDAAKMEIVFLEFIDFDLQFTGINMYEVYKFIMSNQPIVMKKNNTYQQKNITIEDVEQLEDATNLREITPCYSESYEDDKNPLTLNVEAICIQNNFSQTLLTYDEEEKKASLSDSEELKKCSNINKSNKSNQYSLTYIKYMFNLIKYKKNKVKYQNSINQSHPYKRKFKKCETQIRSSSIKKKNQKKLINNKLTKSSSHCNSSQNEFSSISEFSC